MNPSAAYRVLLVEDDPSDANLARQALRASTEPSFEVVWVVTLGEAIGALQQDKFDVLLLDLSLPDSTGFQTVHAVQEQAKELPLIVLTGYDDTDFALRTLEAGAQDYLIKGRFDTDALVRAIRYSIERKRLTANLQQTQENVKKLSWRDPLTGLANRALFLCQVEQTLVGAKRDTRFAAVLLLDLDRFKEINEARGFAIGDALLRAVSARFEKILHADDLLARLDSDEFGVLLPRLLESREMAGRESLVVAEKLRMALSEAIDVGGEFIHIDASVGVAILASSVQETAVEALRQAEMAMTKAKSEGRARTMFFEAEMGEDVKQRFQLEAELRVAIAENQLRLYLQPQVNAQGVQVGAEALVRWQHPSGDLVSPSLFSSRNVTI